MAATSELPSVEPVETQPVLRVIKGDATPEEIAALVAVLAALSAPAAPAPRPVSVWADPRRGVRTTPPHGPGAWRASGLPR
jgi:Acyl-CoA carboxylase epsilon subunit